MSDVKPYRRRYRARSRGGDVQGGIEELRAMNRRGDSTPPDAPEPRRRDPVPSRRDSEPPPREERRPRRPRRWWSLRGRRPGAIVARLAVAFVGLSVLWGALGLFAVWRAAGDAHTGLHKGVRGVLDKPRGGMLSEPTNTLIIGSDARRGASRSARADSIMIMRTDPERGRMRMLSIPRDLRVTLPRYGDEKINAAYRYLGQRGMIRAVQRLTGLPIHHIVVLKFDGLSKAVDAVGGVEVNIPEAMRCEYSGGITVEFPKGRQELDGERALVYSRARKGCGDDFGRMARQQEILAGLKSKLVSPMSLPLAPWRGSKVIRAVTTDLGALDLAKLGWLQAKLQSGAEDRMRIEGFSQTIGGISYVILDREASEVAIANFTS